jgi:uncharacterized membrane protein
MEVAMEIDYTSLQAVLKFLVGGGSSIVVAGALSYLVENWAKWHDLPRWLKITLPILISALLAVGAQILMGYADVVEQISPWFTIIAVAIATWVKSQRTYALTKQTGYGVHNTGIIGVIDIGVYDDSDEEVK